MSHNSYSSIAFATPFPCISLTHQFSQSTITKRINSTFSRRRPRTCAVQLPDPPAPPSPETNSNNKSKFPLEQSSSKISSSPYSYKIPVESPDESFNESKDDIIQSPIDNNDNNNNDDQLTNTTVTESDIITFQQWLQGITPQGRAIRITATASIAFFLFSQLYTQFETSPSFPSSLDMPTASQTLLSSITSFFHGPHFAVAAGMGLSALIQALTGFGFAIVSVGALTQIPWIANSSVFNAIQPVAATLGAFTGWVLLFPEIKKVSFKDISILLIASTITTPIGALLMEVLDADLVIRGLGALISGYVLYAALGVELPKKLGGTSAAWGLGFLAGALGGAFDITGPPLVIHGEAAKWNTENGDFRRNVLAVVSINSTLVVLWDLFAGRLNDFYYFDFVTWAFPTTVVGIVIGKILSKRMNPVTFKRVVLGTCMIMGVKLLIS